VFNTRYDKIRRIGLKVSVIKHPLAIKLSSVIFNAGGLKKNKNEEIK